MVNDILSSLAGGIVNASGGAKGTLAELIDPASPLPGALNAFRNDNKFSDQNNLGLTDKQAEDLSYYGLQGTKEFNEHFGLDPTSKDYASKYKEVLGGLDKLIYTEKPKSN